jgi:hypothetical protein
VTPNENETISPKTPLSETVPTEPQSISGVLTDEPTSSESATHHHIASADDTLPEVSADGPLPVNDADDADEKEETIVETPTANDTTQNVEADIEVPNSISESTPITIGSTAKSPETGHSNGHIASSIDEAIADFKTAIKTPEPESVKAPETLSATEIDETSAQPELSNIIEATTEDKDKTSANANGDTKSTEKVNGTEELSATAPRSVSASPAPPAKEVDDHNSEQGEGTTMEEIDID